MDRNAALCVTGLAAWMACDMDICKLISKGLGDKVKVKIHVIMNSMAELFWLLS